MESARRRDIKSDARFCEKGCSRNLWKNGNHREIMSNDDSAGSKPGFFMVSDKLRETYEGNELKRGDCPDI